MIGGRRCGAIWRGAAFSDAGTEVTSSGFAGVLERIGLGLGGIWEILGKGDYSGKLAGAFGWEEDHPLVDFLFRVRDGATGLYDLLVKGDYTGALQRAFGWEEDSPFVGFLFDARDAAVRLGDYLRDGLVPDLQRFGKWVVDNKDWLTALGVTVGTLVVGMNLWTGAITLWKTITTTATAIQVAFNAAMTANPIGLIVMGIAALVAGLIYFFTQTELGKDIVANVWSFIQTVVGGVVDWFQGSSQMSVVTGV